MKRQTWLIAAGGAGAVWLGGCAPNTMVREVAADQARTIAAIDAAWNRDLVLLGDLLDASLAWRRTMLLGEAHRGLLSAGYITPGLEVDAARFDADLGDASTNNALLEEVRTGRLSADEARAFLRDYALVLRMSDGDARRNELLARLAPIVRHDEAAHALRASLARHAARANELLADARAGGEAVSRFADMDAGMDAFSRGMIREVWAQQVLGEIDDTARREAAARLLDRVLAMGTED